jgi:hypothetical protein
LLSCKHDAAKTHARQDADYIALTKLEAPSSGSGRKICSCPRQ